MASDAGAPPSSNYFGEHLGIEFAAMQDGYSRCTVSVTEDLTNDGNVVHGGVFFSLADTGMWAALNPGLAADEYCTTIEAKIQFMKPVTNGTVVCDTTVVHRGRSIAYLESHLECNEELVASATGTYFIGRDP